MLMLTKTHAAVVAAKDAEIAGLMKRIDRMALNMAADDEEIAHLQQKLRMSEHRYEKLDAQLAVFTAPRARDAKGHFISAKGASA